MNPDKTTRTLTLWTLFLAVEQFRSFRKSCSHGITPCDVYPGIQYGEIAAQMQSRKLYDRLLGSTGTGTNNTIRQHVLRLVGMGMAYQRPGEPEVFIPTPKADDLYTSVEAEGLLPLVMSREGHRKLPELLAFSVLRRMPRAEWNLVQLARATAVGDVGRLQIALDHLNHYVEVQRGGRSERVRMRTDPHGALAIRVRSEDLVARDASSSVMDGLEQVSTQAAPAAAELAAEPLVPAAVSNPLPEGCAAACEPAACAPAACEPAACEPAACEPAAEVPGAGPCPKPLTPDAASFLTSIRDTLDCLGVQVGGFCAKLESGEADLLAAKGVNRVLGLALQAVSTPAMARACQDTPPPPMDLSKLEKVAGKSSSQASGNLLKILGDLFSALAQLDLR